MMDIQTIDTMPIEEVRAGFGAIMAEIVTGYGDNATPAKSAQQQEEQGQPQQESEVRA